MNKSAIQKFAIWARTELIAQVSQRAYQYGITGEGFGEEDALTVGGRALTSDEAKQRRELVAQIRQKGYTQVMEEVAYTWFNRFIALRFMEVNNYLPSHIRVFSDSTGAFKPEILSDVLHLDLPGLDKDKVTTYIESNQTEDLYRYLLLTQCNALNEALPRMFEKMGGYTELLFPNNILKADSVLGRMVTDIPEEDWTDQVQIIGWLYQYYNSELKDDTFALLKKNVKITKERIPSATQLFTPDWIVRYMVENSLGRLWIEGHPDDELKSSWKYYLDEAEQEPEVQKQLDAIHAEYATLKPQDIKVIDPCMGSGHILVYAFDVLIQIYKKYGVSERDAAQSILQNNLYGLDIDDRAAQLAYFAVMMKARQYDRRIFSRGIQPHVHAIVESNGLDSNTIDYFTNNDPKLKQDFGTLVDELQDAKEYGFILNITPVDFTALYARMEAIWDGISLYRENVLNMVLPLILVAEVMAQKYDVVVTNPPYMGSGGMSHKLVEYAKLEYPHVKNDLFSICVQKMIAIAKENGFFAYIAPQSWMFLSTQEGLRNQLLCYSTLYSLLDLGINAFDSGFGTATAVFSKSKIGNLKAICIDLTFDEHKEKAFFSANRKEYASSSESFVNLPRRIFSYSCTERYSVWFGHENIGSCSSLDCGIKTGNNNVFVRLWYEISLAKLAYKNSDLDDLETGKYKWFKYSQGGGFHRWYGAIENVVDFEYDASNIKRTISKSTYRLRDKTKYFLSGMIWPMVGTNNFSSRFLPYDVLPDIASNVLYCTNTYEWVLLSYMNSKVFNKFMILINPTVNYPIDSVSAVPYKKPTSYEKEKLTRLSQNNVQFAKMNWDSYETSWDFQHHPLIRPMSRLADSYVTWKSECEQRFLQLKANEEEVNRIFIDIYSLQDELTPEVADKDVTVHRIFDTKDDVPESMQGSNYVRTKRDEIVSLISYAVGCMFGRYSLDVEGLAYAGGEWDASKYSTIIPDKDNIIPICDDDYFDDDVTGRFVKWVETVYGSEMLEENLKFIADALGGKGTPREVIRSYFLNDFYGDHCKTYQKRPIYWLFDSGKKNGFKALIYMHRYQSDLLARMRTDYVHEQQERYRTQLTHLADALEHASGAERVKLTKKQKTLQDQSLEIQKYEEKIHHLADQNISIDLDDGVKHNYALFADVLAKIK